MQFPEQYYTGIWTRQYKEGEHILVHPNPVYSVLHPSLQCMYILCKQSLPKYARKGASQEWLEHSIHSSSCIWTWCCQACDTCVYIEGKSTGSS